MAESTVPAIGFEPRCLTTAMGIMPHRDPERALELALRFDIPFWPQLPNVTFWEDTYVQTSRGFPGIVVDPEESRITWSEELFLGELEAYLAEPQDSGSFSVMAEHSLTYESFRTRDLSDRAAIRGQFMGPISFCLKVVDADKKPIIYRDDVRMLAIQHIARKVNRQLHELRELNDRAFIWVDEPGLEILFSGITGYASDRAREDMAVFLALLEGPRAVHLCGNPDWDFLLRSDLDLLSFNAFGCGQIFTGYHPGVREFVERGSTICWGIVPTNAPDLEGWDAESLAGRLRNTWRELAGHGLPEGSLAERALITPATCCLVNPDRTASVEKAFELTREVAGLLRP